MQLIRSTKTGRPKQWLPGRRRRRRYSAWVIFRHFPRMIPFIRPHWKLAVAAVAMIGASVAVGLALPWSLAIVIDSVLGRKPLPSILEPILGGLGRYQLLAVVVAGGLVLTAISHGLAIIDNYVSTKLNLMLVLDFRRALYKHAQGLSLGFHDRIPTGQIVFRLVPQSLSIGQIVVSLPPLLQAVVTAIAMLAIAALVDWQLALLSMVVIPILIHATRVYARKVQPKIYAVRELEAASQSTLLEGLSMMRVIMSFGRERHEYGRWNQLAQDANIARIKLTIRQTVYSLVIGTATAAGTALIVGVGAVNVIQGRLTLGELVVLLGYVAAIYSPLTQISGTFSQLQQQFVNFESSLSILDTEPELREAPDAISIGRADGRIQYDNVSFTYPEIDYALMQRPTAQLADGEVAEDPLSSKLPENASRRVKELLARPGMLALYEKAQALGLDVEDHVTATRDPALIDVSFSVEPGQHVALVGPTGAGKTTLVNLLMRFSDPTAGAVLLDGVDLRKLKLASLREQISVVPQEPLLFGGTIGDNIRYGKLGATDDEVIDAARAANIHDFITRLPDDYETVIGERGSQLSGGERQRVSVARAFLKDSPIAVLDEPTSSVDSETEAVILSALDRLMAGRTTFTIAHRLSTVRRADVILVLNEGRLIQQGTHDKLLDEGGIYRKLHDHQAGIAEIDVAADGRGRRMDAPRTQLLLFADLLVAALHSLLSDGSTQDLVALFDAPPERGHFGAAWPLVGGVLAVLRDGSEEPLRALVSRTDPTRGLAQAARHVLEARDTLRAIRQQLAGASGAPLDSDLIIREPWTQLARVSPEAADVLLDRLPKARESAAADGRRRAARRATARRG